MENFRFLLDFLLGIPKIRVKVKIFFYYFILFLSLGFLTLPIYSDSVLSLTDEPTAVNLGKHCLYLEDEEENFEITDVSSPLFQAVFRPIEKKQPGFGYTNSVFWLKCNIENKSKNKLRFFLEIAYPMLDDIRLFSPVSKSSFDEIRTGDNYPFLQRPIEFRNFLFPMEVNSSQVYTFYLRISHKGAMVVPLVIRSENNLIRSSNTEDILIGIFIGISVVMLLYNLFLFTFFKELQYLYYVLFLFGWTLIILAITGISFRYLWPNSVWWNNYHFPMILFFSAIWGILFSRDILNLKENSPIMSKILRNLVYVSAVGICIPLILDYVYSLRLSLLVVGLEVLMIYASVIIVFLKNRSISKYFLLAWSIFFLGIFVYQMHSFGWLETNWLSTWSIQIGASIQVILFALALAERINSIRKEKEEMQEAVIQMQKVAINNIKTTQKQQEQLIAMNQELKIARDIHEAILPQVVPKTKHFGIHVTYIPMAEIGGDLYDFVLSEENQSLGAFIADVTGHGIPAAQLASIVKATFTFHKKHFTKPEKLLKEMNATIISMQNNQMVSAGYLYLDGKERIASYANSGHPPLFHWNSATNEINNYYPEGKILGWMDDSNNKSIQIPFRKGDRFFLFTDGITETRRNTNDIWGEENLSRFLKDHVHLPYNDMVQELIQTLKNFSGREDGFEDDFSLVSIEITS